jgi:hypothetical protein
MASTLLTGLFNFYHDLKGFNSAERKHMEKCMTYRMTAADQFILSFKTEVAGPKRPYLKELNDEDI